LDHGIVDLVLGDRSAVTPLNDYRARVIDFWRAVELFSPREVPPASPRRRVWNISAEGPLPWEAGHPLRDVVVEDGRVWRHTLYGGVFSLDRVHDLLVRTFGEDPESFDTRRRGDSAAFAVVISDEGRPLLGTEVFSSCAWACGRTVSPGPQAQRWLDGFEESATRCEAGFEGLVAALEGDERAAELRAKGILVGRPIDLDDIKELLDGVVETFGVGAVLEPSQIRVESVQVSRRREFSADSSDFLNSFIATDLARVSAAVADGEYGAALAAYLRGSGDDRVDVRTALVAAFEQTAPPMVPAGQWPKDAARPLALSQQFAVNTIMADLGPGTGLFSVNGPPGTGKTTMLRDLIAANVVERARRLARLDRPAQAFTEASYWKSGEYRRTIHGWRPDLTGFEMVVASANNGAVENVTLEIPAHESIEPWQKEVDHYTELATALLGGGGRRAWGLIAAKLGNKKNREDFRDVFWFTDKQSGRLGFQDILKGCTPSQTAWSDAVRAFRRADDHVNALRGERAAVYQALREAPGVESELRRERSRLKAAGDRLVEIRNGLPAAQEAEAAADKEVAERTSKRHQHRDLSPGFVTALFTLGRAVREWRTEDRELAARVRAAEEEAGRARALVSTIRSDERQAAAHVEEYQRHVGSLVSRQAELTRAVSTAAERWGVAVPTDDWWSDERRRELTAPWSDAEWSDARVRLFIEALRLHKAFCEAEPERMRKNLHAAMDLLQGSVPSEAPQAGVQAAWQSLFFVVPVISTAFASVSRLFRHLGRESFGWLFIDEAGQAAPQQAVGAIWRARRAVVVGDPLQLEPVVTLPFKAQQVLRCTYDVGEMWLPGGTSAQRLADQVNRYGTLLPDGDDGQVWVGAPLRVHRRCLDPMFTISNTVAYDGLMTYATPDRSLGNAPASKWLHVSATESNGHWIPAEGMELRRVLTALRDRCGVPLDQIFVIAPFRDVADRLRRDFPEIRGGTIHTAQGKEAEVVILILGGDPSKPGARSWAARRPNLVNVAASRARQRLYVIGDHTAWSDLPHFKTIAQHLRADSAGP
jgi:hypothetical protein